MKPEHTPQAMTPACANARMPWGRAQPVRGSAYTTGMPASPLCPAIPRAAVRADRAMAAQRKFPKQPLV